MFLYKYFKPASDQEAQEKINQEEVEMSEMSLELAPRRSAFTPAQLASAIPAPQPGEDEIVVLSSESESNTP